MTTDLNLLLARQSPLALRDPVPDEAALAAMLRGAMCAPDHGKLKPWRFIVITGEARHAFGTVLSDALRQRDPGASEAMLAREKAKPLRAPLILTVVARIRERRLVPAIEQIIATGIAANNILLAAHGLGYGGMWRTGEAAYDQYVHRALGLGASDSIVGFLYLGTPEVMPPAREIPALQPFVSHWNEIRDTTTARVDEGLGW